MESAPTTCIPPPLQVRVSCIDYAVEYYSTGTVSQADRLLSTLVSLYRQSIGPGNKVAPCILSHQEHSYVQVLFIHNPKGRKHTVFCYIIWPTGDSAGYGHLRCLHLTGTVVEYFIMLLFLRDTPFRMRPTYDILPVSI